MNHRVNRALPLLMALVMLLGIGGTALAADATGSGNSGTAGNAKPVGLVTVKGAVGKITGYQDNGLYAFRGIPYATAERFQSPAPVTKYPNGNCVALTYGPVSPQDRTLSATAAVNAQEFRTPSNGTADMVGNETCQYLNVWTSSLTAKRPVIVFFHGGGLSNGASSELSYYTGEYLVQQQDVVFVSVNHRLNVLGYLDMSAYGDQFADSAIAGMQDCVVALQWVQDNIAAMGGDPDNVTIVGQSGGGAKVTTLACMSDTVDLFDKVFVMSGGYSNDDKASGLANTRKLVEHLGLAKDEVARTLVNMPYEELYNATVAAGCNWTTCYGNGAFKTPFFDSNGNLNQYAAQRKWIVGTTFSEFSGRPDGLYDKGDAAAYVSKITDAAAMKRLTENYSDNARAVADGFKKAYPNKPLAHALFLNTLPSGLMSRAALINTDLSKLAASGADVYNYVVSYTSPYMGTTTMHHSGDIGYWFYAISAIPYQIRGDEKNAYAVADAMSSALAAFAATGNPSTSKLQWKPWTANQHNTMVFDTKCELKVDFDSELCSAMSAQK